MVESARRFRVLELYAGAGGAGLGLRAAGWEHVAAVDNALEAHTTAKAAGFPAVLEHVGRYLDEHVLPSVDLVWASPPCQGYARGGRRLGALDVRDGWSDTKLAAELVDAEWLVVGNVVGAPVEDWAAELRELGFAWVGVWLFDAADYGLPQRRRRYFIVAGPVPVRRPLPTHCDPVFLDDVFAPRLRPWVSMADALGLEAVGPRRPAPTVTTGDGAGCFGRLSRLLVAEQIGRPGVSWREAATLQGFPPDYLFAGSNKHKHRQIGDAVPPILAELIGAQIRATMERRL